MYPKIRINVNGILDNMKAIKQQCETRNVKLAVVTKLLSGNKEIVKDLVENGVKCICDSKISNLRDYTDLNVEKWLIRLPSLSEVHDAVKYADVSLNSELSTIKALNQEALLQGKTHKVILMYELGDLREGCMKDELKYLVAECLKLSNIELYGIGVNLSCFGEIMPSCENMMELSSIVKELENEFNIHFKVVSGGNSSSYKMLVNDELPSEINNLRIGESIYLGGIPCLEEKIDGLKYDNFILQTQIIELKEKPSLPWGIAGNSNSFGEHSNFEDKGTRKRAIIGIGRQDVKMDAITPIDKKISILGGSSDHIVVDVTDSDKKYNVGDIIEFSLNYSGVLSVMTSKFVEKEIEK